jgi:mannose-1-phosphate guanylyltransferase
MLHAVIMAGGSGTRFWPESREARPKQLSKLVGDRTMIQATVDRLAGLVPPQRILVVTNRRQAAAIAEQLPELPPESILAEPCKRDTAPCIGWAATHIMRTDPLGTMLVMPSDHVIRPTEQYQAVARAAAEHLADFPNRLITFGIRPSYPAESFGYIERGDSLPIRLPSPDFRAFHVDRFREKPKAEVAKEYLASGRFYWNSGIFVWTAHAILQAIKQFQPELYGHLDRIQTSFHLPKHPAFPKYEEVLESEFAAINPISIDYAVLEHSKNVAVIEAPFEWDDVGSWQAIARLLGVDADGNTITGRHVGLRTTGTIVRTDDNHLVATLGASDLIIVHTPDATLVANRNDEESIRQLVKMLDERGWKEYL